MVYYPQGEESEVVYYPQGEEGEAVYYLYREEGEVVYYSQGEEGVVVCYPQGGEDGLGLHVLVKAHQCHHLQDMEGVGVGVGGGGGRGGVFPFSLSGSSWSKDCNGALRCGARGVFSTCQIHNKY